MSQTFEEVLNDHMARYPKMEPQDYGKLAFQSEFGPEHLMDDFGQISSNIWEELSALRKDSAPPPPEPIGNGLCRFHLDGTWKPNEAAALLTKVMALTVKKVRGTADGLGEKLALLERLPVPGMEEWLAWWRAQGCRPVHHSDVYRAFYHPHYRLLAMEYAGCFPALLEIGCVAGRGGLVAIDGRCGSGKTRFAQLIRRLFSCNVFHMDDFCKPLARRPSCWEQVPAGNMDLERFREEVLLPAKAGRRVDYRPYDCRKGEYAPASSMAPQKLIVVEGSYSQHPILRPHYDLTIFLTCDREEQVRRLKVREGEHFPAFAQRWIPLEEHYFKCCGVEGASHITVDTTGFARN